MLLEYVATDAGVEGIFVTAVTIITVVAMVLGYWSSAMLLASTKRENETLRGALSWKEQKIEHLEARNKRLEKVVAPKDLEQIKYGGEPS